MTRHNRGAQLNAPKNTPDTPENSAEHAYKTHAHAKSGLKQEAPRSLGLNLPEETEETEDFEKVPESPTQAAQNESYKAQKSNFPPVDSEKWTRAPWKKGFWTEIVDDIADEIGPQTFYSLRNACWIDRREGDLVFIAVESQAMRDLLSSRAAKLLTDAFSKALNQPVRARFEYGSPRVMEPPKAVSHLSGVKSHENTPSKTGDEAELALLHDKYGDIMGIVDKHPLFKRVQLPREKGGWGIFPQLLTNKCKEYGVMTVLRGLRFVSNRPSVIDHRAFFLTALDKGQFGYRLAVSPSVVGRVAR